MTGLPDRTERRQRFAGSTAEMSAVAAYRKASAELMTRLQEAPARPLKASSSEAEDDDGVERKKKKKKKGKKPPKDPKAGPKKEE